MPIDFQLENFPLDIVPITSEMGNRTNSTGFLKPHYGIDLKTENTLGNSEHPVFAAQTGVILKVGWTNGGHEQNTRLGYGREGVRFVP